MAERAVTIQGRSFIEEELICPDCGAAMHLLLLVSGEQIGQPCYVCDVCPARHAAHSDGRPTGVPADRITRAARAEAHKLFDRLWRVYGMSRGAAYKLMASVMGLPSELAHIGKFTRAQCMELIARLEKLFNELPRRGE